LLLERRLSRALDAADLRADSQFGFRARRGTLDAAFVLRSVFDSAYTSKFKATPLFACFIDFQKAFDSVSRPLLWRILRNLHLPDAFISAVISYYSSVEFMVEHPAGLGPRFSSVVGVKQGCPLSPVLFGVFIEYVLRDFLDSTLSPTFSLPLLMGQETPPILYADDLTLLSTSVAGLRSQLSLLSEVAHRYGLVINVAKTKAMAFHLSGPKWDALRAAPLLVAGGCIEWVEEFRYLGLVISRTSGFARAAEVLHDAAVARYYAMWRRCREKGVEDAASLSLLFDSLVTTVLGYGAALWGPDVFAPVYDAAHALVPLDDPPASSLALKFERLQRRFARSLFGLPRHTSHLVLHLESGRGPLSLFFYGHAIRFFHRLMSYPPDSLLGRALRASAQPAAAAQGSWLARFQQWASSLGSPFDLASVAPPLPGPISRVQTRTQARLVVPTPMPSRGAALQTAYELWFAQLSPRAATLPPVHTLLSLLSRDRTSSPLSWRRRPPLFYAHFPLLSDRSLVSRSRLGVSLRSLSIYSTPSLDSRAHDPGPRPRPSWTLCPSCPDFTPSTDSFSSLSHCLFCSHPHIRAISGHCSIPDSLSLDLLLSSPPPSWPRYLRLLSRYFTYLSNNLPTQDLLRLMPFLSHP
jgi:hypothetical protein